MTDPDAARSFLQGEVEGLEPFEFLGVVPAGNPLHVVEVTRREDGGLEVRVPGRPRPVPELPVPVRSALREQGFASAEPGDRTIPWVHAVADAATAVGLVQRVLTEVFGEKPNVVLDIGHGSHKAEHETQQKLAAARERVESVLKEMLGRRADQDPDGDFVLQVDNVHVMIAPRAGTVGPVIVRVFAVTNVGVTVTPELGLFLARLNFGLMFGRFTLDAEHRSIWFDETLLGDQFSDELLRFTIRVVAATADQWDDRLKQMFGGATYEEVLKDTPHEVPRIKPGEGGYL